MRTLSAMVLRQMLPWQINSIFIIVLFLLDLPGNALFCEVFRMIYICSEMTECGKSEQDLASYYYRLVVKLVVKRGWVTTKKTGASQ